MRFAVEDFFFLRVAQVKKAKDFFSDELHTRARTWKPSRRPRKARRWLCEGKVPCVLNQEISFLVHEYLGSERPISFEYWLLLDLVYEEAMCEGSSGNGLPYAAKAVP